MKFTTSEVDKEVLSTYQVLKANVLSASSSQDAESCLEHTGKLWMFMNRFRNCDLGIYYDEDVHHAISVLNPPKLDELPDRKKKKEYRLAFIVLGLSDLGGASVPHRFMLPKFEQDGFSVCNYMLATNYFKRPFVENESYRYLMEVIQPEEFEYLPCDLSHVDRAHAIVAWLRRNKIDMVVADTCPSTLYALASKPVPVIATLSQDCYTFALGPGTADITYLVTLDQLFKYNFKFAKPSHVYKVAMLPLHSRNYVEDSVPIPRSELGLPDNAVVSGSSNMWKSFFGDSEILMEQIATLLRMHPNYYHIFIGTSRCCENLDSFLARNQDIRNRVIFAGPIENIYRILKSMDFWVNSFPTSGGTDIEMAILGKPTIETVATRNLDLHPAEFLNSHECTVTSRDEFIEFGSRLITDEAYRRSLGEHLKNNISREFDKELLVSERIYKTLVSRYNQNERQIQNFKNEVQDVVAYEKRISLYNAYGCFGWPMEKKIEWLKSCIEAAPMRPYGWIRLLELSVSMKDTQLFDETSNEVLKRHKDDHRVQLLISVGMELLHSDWDSALSHARLAVQLSRYDEMPHRHLVSLKMRLGMATDDSLILNHTEEQKRGIKDGYVADPELILKAYYTY